MNLFELENKPLLIEIEPDDKRLVAAIFPLTKKPGILFFDICWPQSSGHPFHIVDGELSGENPWFVGDHKISLLSWDTWETDEEETYLMEWDRCQRARLEDPITKETVNNQDFIDGIVKEYRAMIN